MCSKLGKNNKIISCSVHLLYINTVSNITWGPPGFYHSDVVPSAHAKLNSNNIFTGQFTQNPVFEIIQKDIYNFLA